MKVAILANNAASFIAPMAQGLQKMFNQVGIEAQILYHGLDWLRRPGKFQGSGTIKLLNLITKTQIYRLLFQLHSFDVIVIVINQPRCFEKRLQIETIRKVFPAKIIVAYSLHYLLTCGWWEQRIKHGDATHGILPDEYLGLDRYDWYFIATFSGLKPLPTCPQPVSQIGINLDDSMLFPELKESFIALLDFEQPLYLKERALQIQALEETKTPYIVLNGYYSISEIRMIYRKCSIYFQASLDSFGLPICELQACGAYIFTPYLKWCPGHWIKDNVYSARAGKLSPNFIIYENDKAKLIDAIQNIKHSYNAQTVRSTFKEYHSHFLYGDIAELQRFVDMVRQGKIHSQSHLLYNTLTGVELHCRGCGKRLSSFAEIGRFSPDCFCKECLL
jgi:glycosyltransferase involved in cell wall biosynthesis